MIRRVESQRFGEVEQPFQQVRRDARPALQKAVNAGFGDTEASGQRAAAPPEGAQDGVQLLEGGDLIHSPGYLIPLGVRICAFLASRRAVA